MNDSVLKYLNILFNTQLLINIEIVNYIIKRESYSLYNIIL